MELNYNDLSIYITEGYGALEFEKSPIRTTCPTCGVNTSPTVMSYPDYQQILKYKPLFAGIVYTCTACRHPIFIRQDLNYSSGGSYIRLFGESRHIEKPEIPFDYTFVPKTVGADFKEALKCYQIGALNAFGSMCRRTIQSMAMLSGGTDSNKVQNQIKDMKSMSDDIDDETFEILQQIILDGHDGAHPHLPELSPDRAEILLELMKDVMYQLYVRKGKMNQAAALRKQKIEEEKNKE